MVEIIRNLCEQKGTSLKALERTLGFGNGTIRRWGKSSPSFDKIQKVADFFEVSVETITGEIKKEPPIESGLSETKQELIDIIRADDMDEEQAAAWLSLIKKTKK